MNYEEAIAIAQAAKTNDICSPVGRALIVLHDALNEKQQEAQSIYSHKWDRSGERCVKCGDKDWMGGSCAVPDASQSVVSDGWKLVPIEPTEEQGRIGSAALFDGHGEGDIYRFMVDAAPQAPAQADAQADCTAVIRFDHSTKGNENEMPKVVSCNRLPDGDYRVYLRPADPAAIRNDALEDAMRLVRIADSVSNWSPMDTGQLLAHIRALKSEVKR